MGVENLSEQFENVPWSWLRPHYEQSSLILVNPALLLSDAAQRVADDDAATIKTWLASGLLSRPTAKQVELWEQSSAQNFSIFVVQPFVLVQPGESDQVEVEH